MSDVTQDAWFFSQGSERIGPVTLSDLRIKASEGALNPRLDMVWTHGMEGWKPAGEVEGLFERRAAPEPARELAPAADPYTPPQQVSHEEAMSKEGGWPGARRRSYLFAIIALPFLLNFGAATLTVTFEKQFGKELGGYILMGVMILTICVTIFYSLQRLVNLGMSRWWFLGNFVPFLNFWLGYRTFACPGGYAYHKKLDGAGIVLAIIYWLLIALGVVAIGLALAALMGAFGSPELRQQIQEAMRHAMAASAKQ